VSERPQRVGLNIVLYAVVLLLACACVVGGVFAWGAHQDRVDAAEEQEPYGDVLAAARQEAEAFINIRHDDAEASIDKVVAGATGDFRSQYTKSTASVVRVLKESESVMEGEVVWAGVVDVDQDSATVLAATSGTVANKQTGGKPVARHFRLRLDLVREDGKWLTDDLQFVS
jgi:Mce-associated membrane protein